MTSHFTPRGWDELVRDGHRWQFVRDDGRTIWCSHWKRADAEIRVFLPRDTMDTRWRVLLADWRQMHFASQAEAFEAAANQPEAAS